MILTTQAQVQEAGAADLIETFEHLTGKRLARFSSLAVGRARVTNAMLAAADATGHLGVAKGADAQPLSAAEREEIKPGAGPIEGLPGTDEAWEASATKARILPTDEEAAALRGEPEDRTPPPAPIWPGTERRAEPREEPAAGAEERPNVNSTRNPFKKGTPEHQLWIQSNTPKEPPARPAPKAPSAPRRTSVFTTVIAAGNGESKVQAGSRRAKCLGIIQRHGRISMEDLEAELGEPARGFVQKLLEKKHVRVE
jgi:hypothetical protein